MIPQMAFSNQEAVASWTAQTFNIPNYPVNMALGIYDPDGLIIGSVLFQDFNGSNVEISIFGDNVLTRDIIKKLALICLNHFRVNRLSARTLKKRKRLIRGLMKLGFKFEGVSRKYYGPTDAESAVRLVAFRDGLKRMAGIK